MAKQLLNRGTSANDGTGDTLRVAAQKINENFSELYTVLGGDAAASQVNLSSEGAIFEGLAENAHETLLAPVEPTQDNTILMPNSTGTIILDSDTQTLSNKTILSPSLTTPSIKDTDSSHSYNFVVSNLTANRNVTLPLLTGHDTFVFESHIQTLTNKTIIEPVINTPKLGGLDGGALLVDSSDNGYLEFDKTASAVNHVKIRNAEYGVNNLVGDPPNGPQISPDGTGTDISLELAAKGTGGVEIKNKLVLEKGLDVSSTVGIDQTVPMTIFNSGSLISPTISDGLIQGEVKYLINTGAGEARLTTGTPSRIFGVADGGHISFSEGDGCILVWNDTKSKWFFVSNNGTTIG